MATKSELSEKKKREFMEAFSLFDKDGDKKISEEELASVRLFRLAPSLEM